MKNKEIIAKQKLEIFELRETVKSLKQELEIQKKIIKATKSLAEENEEIKKFNQYKTMLLKKY